jgi:tetratricopeptide (TPR) repeat protein
MFQFSDGPGRSRLKRETVAYFEKAGWAVKAQRDARFDFRIGKRGIHAFVICIDEKIKNFVGPTTVIEHLKTISLGITRSHGMNYLAVSNFVFTGLSFETVAATGVLIVRYDELELVDHLVRFYHTVPTNLTNRELGLIQGSRELCYSIADSLGQRGDRQAAVEWLERAIKGSPSLIWPYKRLSDFYRESGDLKAAEQVALEAFDVDPKSIEIMRVMQKISEARGDVEIQLHWAREIEDAEKKAPDFESIVRRQDAQAKASGCGKSEGIVSRADVETRAGGLLSRILRLKNGAH